MSVSKDRILVVGGGIAGLTAAAALGQKGFAVELVERNPEISDGGGVGLSLVSNALRALDEIGVAEACVAAGVPADSMAMCRPDGALIFENPLPRIGGPQWPGATGIRRSVFHGILLDAARRAGVELRCGVSVDDWREGDDGLAVAFTDGGTGAYALMVAADGLYSKTRSRLNPASSPTLTGQAVWRAATPRPASITRTHLFIGGRHGVVGICPVSDEDSYLYIVEAVSGSGRREPETLHLQMREALEDYGGVVHDLAETLERPEQVNYRPLEWMLAPRPWGFGRVVMIGDAVHANPPVLAQGAAMAIEDGVVLASELCGLEGVHLALERFIDRRFARAAGVVETSCQLARWEVEHTPNIDIAGVMKSAAMELAKPY